MATTRTRPLLAAQRIATRHYGINDFSGGVNLRDAPDSLPPNQAQDAWNVSLSEKGLLYARLGFSKYNQTPYNQSAVTRLFEWKSGGSVIVQSGASLYRDTSGTPFKTFTTADPAAFADFTGRLYFTHPVDGMFYYDGNTVTAVPTGPKGKTMAAWLDGLWVAGDPAQPTRLYRSKLGDGTVWDTASGAVTNDIRDGPTASQPIVCIHVGVGFDQQTRPALIVAKRNSTHRVYDSSTGAYITLDASTGAASPQSMVALLGRVFVLSERGIYATNGLSPLVLLSQPLEPLFRPEALNLGKVASFCAGFLGRRLYFSIVQAGFTAPNLCIEMNPLFDSFTLGSHAMASYATVGGSNENLLGASPSVNGQVYTLESGGTDDGAAISSRWRSGWLQIGGGHLSRFHRVGVLSRGTFTLTMITDGAQEESLITPRTGGFAWDKTDKGWDKPGVGWDVGGEDPAWLAVYPRLVGRMVSVQIAATSTQTLTSRRLPGGVTPVTGAWQAQAIELDYTNLGG